MPDPIEFVIASVVSTFTSFVCVLILRYFLPKWAHRFSATTCVGAVTAGLIAGYYLLNFSLPWPPGDSLGRFLLILLPAVVALELSPGLFGRSEKFIWSLRFLLCASAARILLHGSVYLSDEASNHADAWSVLQQAGFMIGSTALLFAVWFSFVRLSKKSEPCSIVFSFAMAIQCAGLATMLAGYIKGGTAAIPFAGTLAGTAIAVIMKKSRRLEFDREKLDGVIGLGVISLFSLLTVGRFFGNISSWCAIFIFLAPLGCFVTNLSFVKNLHSWQIIVLRLILVSMPLAAIQYLAKQEFDQKMGPLLMTVSRADAISVF